MPGILAGQLRDKLAVEEKKLFLMAWHLERLGKKPSLNQAHDFTAKSTASFSSLRP